MTVASTLDKSKPDWAGEDWLSRLVNGLIHIKPLYGLMKQQARRVLIRTAEEKGVPWQRIVQSLEQAGLEAHLPELTNPQIQDYPAYYQVPFHAYDAGNLCWLAAWEAEPATYAMALRVWPKEDLTPETAQDRLRSSFLQVMGNYCEPVVRDALDVGCSIGISTRYLHRYLRERQQGTGIIPKTIGLDLSPQMLAVARHQDTEGQIHQWVHGLAEAMPFREASFDVVTIQFLLHELPNQATREIFQEIYRVLRPGGLLAITDNNPRSPVIQNLPPVLFTLMKSTEPWSDEYYTFDVEGNLTALGYHHCLTDACDPRHRVILAQKPLGT